MTSVPKVAIPSPDCTECKLGSVIVAYAGVGYTVAHACKILEFGLTHELIQYTQFLPSWDMDNLEVCRPKM